MNKFISTLQSMSNDSAIQAKGEDKIHLGPFIKKYPEICSRCKKRYLCLVDLSINCYGFMPNSMEGIRLFVPIHNRWGEIEESKMSIEDKIKDYKRSLINSSESREFEVNAGNLKFVISGIPTQNGFNLYIVNTASFREELYHDSILTDIDDDRLMREHR